MALTNDQVQRIEMTKKIATEELQHWRENRATTLETLKATEAKTITKPIEELFLIADQLTDVIANCIDIEHHFTPEIVAVVSSVVFGITKGHGVMNEVENLLRISEGNKNNGMH